MCDHDPGTIPRPAAVPVKTREPFVYIHVNKCAGSAIEIKLGIPKSHDTAAQIRDRIGQALWDRVLSFASIRNPFARVVSIYYQRRRLGVSGLLEHPVGLDDWVEAVWQRRDPRYADGGVLLGPATVWVCEPGTRDLMVDDILRVERMEEDWARLAGRLGVSSVLERWNVNPHPPHREVLSPASRCLIESAFADDFDLFDYDW